MLFPQDRLLCSAKIKFFVRCLAPFQESLTLAAVFVFAGILVKLLGRRDNDPAPKINDFAVATSISLMTLSKIVADIFSVPSPSRETVLAEVIGILAPLLFAVMDRFVSWHDLPAGQPRAKSCGWVFWCPMLWRSPCYFYIVG
jgi:hypothetical protein